MRRVRDAFGRDKEAGQPSLRRQALGPCLDSTPSPPSRKILNTGLPGAGKTTLARLLNSRLKAVHLNADEVRAKISPDLGFSLADVASMRTGWSGFATALRAAGVIRRRGFRLPDR